MWRHIAQSLQGPSHVAAGSPCQDSHAVRVFGAGDQQALLACVADGAGSAKHSEVGSAIACETLVERATQRYERQGNFDGVTQQEVLDWCDAAVERLQFEAAIRDCSFKDLATTLCAALITANHSHFFQIGDGAVVVVRGGAYGVAFWPQSGEYANTTNFLTTDQYRQCVNYVAVPGRTAQLALLTDGIERLALKFDSQTPHAQFFQPLFAALKTAADPAPLNEQLRQFLDGDSMKSRSDDDKTLILACYQSDDHAD